MSKVQQFQNLLDTYIRKGAPYQDPLKCQLFSLYASMTPDEKSQLKSSVGDKWKYVAEITGWGSGVGKSYCAQHTGSEVSAQGNPEGSPSSSVPWSWIIGGVVLLLIILAAVFFLMRR